MKKRFFVAFFIFVIFVLCFPILIACENTSAESEGLHVSGGWVFDSENHWKICNDCGEIFDKNTHEYDENGFCKVCGVPVKGSDGLVFTKNNFGGYYVSGAGTAKGEIVIPLYHEGSPVIGIASGAFKDNTTVTKVTIDADVCDIGDEAFMNCTSLVSINLSKGTYISEKAFYGCTSLSDIALDDGIMFIEDYAFYGCSALKSFKFPAELTDMNSYVLSECTSLESVEMSDKVENIAYKAFSNCVNLKDVKIGESVKSIESSAFEGCSLLASVAISDSVVNISSYAFADCTLLSNIDLGNGIEEIGDKAFANCTSLSSVTIPSSVKTIGDGVFSGSGIRDITVDENNNVYKSVDGNLLSKDGKTFVHYAVGKSQTSFTVPSGVEMVQDSAFETARNIFEIILPEGVLTIGNDAFAYCSGLESISIPYTVFELGNYVFEGCSSIENIDIPSDVKVIGNGAFADCVSLKSIVIPDRVNKLGFNPFYNCDSLEHVTIGDGIEYLYEYTFSGLPSLRTVEIGKSLYSSLDADMFYQSSNVENIVISSENVFYKSVDGNILSKEGEILYYYLPSNSQTSFTVYDGVTTISYAAFAFNKSLASVTIPSSVTNIWDGAFAECDALTSITIPYGVASMGGSVFNGCDNLSEIYCEIAQEPATWSKSWNDSQAKVVWGLENIKDDTDFDYIISNGKAYLTGYKSDSTEIVIPQQIGGYDVSGFGTIFSNNENIVTVSIPSTVEIIATSAFEYCTALTNVDITDGVKIISSFAFWGCTALEEISLPDSLEEINNMAFAFCDSISYVYIGKNLSSSLIETFRSSDNIKCFTVSEENTSYKSIDGNLYSKDGTILYRYASGKEEKSFTVPYGVKKLDWHCFEHSSLEEIVLNEQLEEISSYAFGSCKNIVSMAIPSSVIYISGFAFENCEVERVIFDDSNRWIVDQDENIVVINADDLNNPITAAKYIVDTYLYSDWKKVV